MATYSNNITIANAGQHLLIQSATSGSGTLTSSEIAANGDVNSEWILNGAIWIPITGSAIIRYIQFSHDGGTNWFDIDSRVPNITNQGGAGTTEVKFLFNNFPIGFGARFRLRRNNGTGSDTINVWAWATRKNNTP